MNEITKKDLKEYKKEAKKILSRKRFHHTMCVENMAVKLSKKHKADIIKSKAGAILHDIMKETSKQEILKIFEEDVIIKSGILLKPKQLWHSAVGSMYAQQVLGVQDQDVLNAISYHTTARPNMSTLEKIIYVSDMISKDRKFDGVKKLRKIAFENLDDGVIACLEQNICFIKNEDGKLDTLSEQALESIKNTKGKT